VKRLLALLVVLLCAGCVVAYQATRPAQAPAGARVFVPSPQFFLDFSPSFRTSLADIYYLSMVQYYGEHIKGDGKLDSLPQMVDLVTRLSPKFKRAYLFGALALVDAGRAEAGYEALKRGFEQNPDDYRFPAYLGFFIYRYGQGKEKDRVAAQWYRQAAEIPGSPEYLGRLAAVLMAKGGETEKAIAMWGEVYTDGDKYSRRRAVTEIDKLLPTDKDARMKALAPLVDTMPAAQLDELIAGLFKDYVQ
jgi:tetratricopeptide (TPR) repeat protein